MKLEVIGKTRTDLHPEDITGATLYLVVGKFGDTNLDHAIALEGSLEFAYEEVDGVRRRDLYHLAFEEPFEMPQMPEKIASAIVILNTKSGPQVAKVPGFSVREREAAAS